MPTAKGFLYWNNQQNILNNMTHSMFNSKMKTLNILFGRFSYDCYWALFVIGLGTTFISNSAEQNAVQLYRTFFPKAFLTFPMDWESRWLKISASHSINFDLLWSHHDTTRFPTELSMSHLIHHNDETLIFFYLK